MGLAVFVEIDELVGMPIATQKLTESQGGRAMHGAHDHCVTQAFLDQREATQNEGTHEHLAQLGIFRD